MVHPTTAGMPSRYAKNVGRKTLSVAISAAVMVNTTFTATLPGNGILHDMGREILNSSSAGIAKGPGELRFIERLTP